MNTLTIRQGTAVIAAAALAVGVGGTTASAAGDEVLASIHVALDLPYSESSGPMEFAVTDVPVGDGPELTGDDLTSNPSNWCGDIVVDIDLDLGDGAIVVSGGEDYCDFEIAEMTVEFDGPFTLSGAYATEDTLFAEGLAHVEYGVNSGVLSAIWEVEDVEELGSVDMSGETEFWIASPEDFPFVDVGGDTAYPATYSEHWIPIFSMAERGISNGWSTPAGQEYRPFTQTTRDALAAFLYRAYGDEVSVARIEAVDEEPPFIDVSSDPTSPDYSEHWEAIYWMASEGLTSGWATADGAEFRPEAPVTRDAVAAFLYRIGGSPETAAGPNPFVDVSSEPGPIYSEHAGAIAWLYESGLSNGWNTPEGPEYRPTAKITRDAIAAFLFRAMERATDTI